MPATDRIPDFTVKINGSDLSEAEAADVTSVIVEQDVDALSMATVEMMTWDIQKQEFTWVDQSKFSEGAPLVILMGYADGAMGEVFNGEITGIELEIPQRSYPRLILRAYDRRHRLMRGRKTKSFLKMKDSDIARQLASDAGLSPQVTDSGIKHEYVLQHNQTNMEFLQDRAGRIGYEISVDGTKLLFRPRDLSASPVVTLDWEADIIDFYARTSTIGLAGKSTVRGWDIMQKQAIVSNASSATKALGSSKGFATADSKFGAAEYSSVQRPLESKAEGDNIAQGRFDEEVLSYVQADILCEGLQTLKAGTTLKIDQIGKRFSGTYYISGVRHTYLPREGYRTRITARSNSING